MFCFIFSISNFVFNRLVRNWFHNKKHKYQFYDNNYPQCLPRGMLVNPSQNILNQLNFDFD